MNIFWFRRDLRLNDNAGLYHALRAGLPLLPVFIFDTHILDRLADKKDARVAFLHQELQRLDAELRELGSSLLVLHGLPAAVWENLSTQYPIHTVFANHDFEPYARLRDEAVQALLAQRGTAFKTFKDHVVFEKSEVVKDNGLPYTVFTPYSKKWLEKLRSKTSARPDGKVVPFYLKPYPNEKYFDRFLPTAPFEFPNLERLGFEPPATAFPVRTVTLGLIKNYAESRDFPAQNGTSKLGLHFRFGTISVREKALKAMKVSPTFLNELIWRDFYAMILWHFPHVAEGPFKKEYAALEWRNNEREFQLWCEGRTGYPLVDAGMRELLATGHMHNRVRMVVASFLTKHLLINWQWGEAWFAEKLLDFDLASNNGGWQWAAGCGTDAAPYFRIFNPESQLEKFDKDLKYVRKWVPEYGTARYPDPIVDHKLARERCLATYKAALNRGVGGEE